MVTETDRNKARSAVVSAYNALDCVGMPVPFLHAFADAAVDAVSTDAEPGTVLKNAIRAVSEAFDPSSMLPITENQAQRRAIRSLNRLSALYAEPVKTAPAVAVKALEWDGVQASSPTGFYRVQRLDDKWEPLHNGYYMLPRLHGVVKAFDTQEEAKAHCQKHHDAAIRSALSAQVQDVAENALDWSGFKGVQINKDWTPDDQELIYTALGIYDGEGDMDDDAREQIIERLLAAWQSSTSPASKHGDAE